MSGRGRASREASAVTVTAYMILAAASILAVAAACIMGARPVQALPSYARQTGSNAPPATMAFPSSRPMAGSSSSTANVWTGGTSNFPPIAAMAIPSFTNVRKGVDGGLRAQVSGPYNNATSLSQAASSMAARYSHGLGTFAQVTYDNVPNTIHWDNIDLRYALPSELFGREAVLRRERQQQSDGERCVELDAGLGLPLSCLRAGATPGAITLIEGTSRSRLSASTPIYTRNRLVYAEFGGYRTLSPRTLTTLGTQPEGTSAFRESHPLGGSP